MKYFAEEQDGEEWRPVKYLSKPPSKDGCFLTAEGRRRHFRNLTELKGTDQIESLSYLQEKYGGDTRAMREAELRKICEAAQTLLDHKFTNPLEQPSEEVMKWLKQTSERK